MARGEAALLCGASPRVHALVPVALRVPPINPVWWCVVFGEQLRYCGVEAGRCGEQVTGVGRARW